MPLLVPVNPAHLFPPQPRPGLAGLAVQCPVRRRQQLAASAAGDRQQTLTRPEGSIRPDPGTRGGTLLAVFLPGLQPPAKAAACPASPNLPVDRHRHGPPPSKSAIARNLGQAQLGAAVMGDA